MDIEKEREAFEQHLTDTGLVEFAGYGFAVDECGEYLHEPTQVAWDSWLIGLNRAKAQAIPEGFVLVPKKSIEHWYLDEGEFLWMDEPDNWLCDMDVGDVQEVEHKEYIVTESNTLYATKVWDGENQAVSSWEFFNSKDDAEKAAEYCKAMIEAVQEQSHDS